VKNALIVISAIAATALHAAPLTVTATPIKAAFTYQLGGVIPPAAKISIRASVGTPSFTTAITPVAPALDANWLTVSPDSGKLPGSLSLLVNPTSLPASAIPYAAVLTVTVTGVNPLTIPVTLTVNPAPPSLSLSTALLNFAVPVVPPGSTGQVVLLSVSGSSPVSYTATAGSVPWLQVSPQSGFAFSFAPAQLAITVDASSLAPQAKAYVAKVTVVAAGVSSATRTQNITVSLTVNAAPPTITSIFPAMLPANSGPWTITIRGTNIYKSTVAKVQGVAIALATTYISSTALSAIVPASILTVPTTLNVLLTNPAPAGDSATSPLVVGTVSSISDVASTASYSTTSFSPGELVTIFGTNIGPTPPASMSITNGYVDTTLNGVTVTVDGQPAPIIYANGGQINLQVPYEVTIGAGKVVSVTNGAAAPVTTTITTVATAPGMFIYIPDPANPGGGQVAALNYNATTGGYITNSGTAPARIGDTVLLYITGEGNYLPAPVLPLTTNTGWIVPLPTPPGTLPPQISPLPSVTIGGAAAAVQYAGPVVGSITGLMQMNVVIPASSTTGALVPISVSIGGNPSQAATTISIHP